ncbi:unnamed protein product [Linum tenue]|uniref:Uncharacterized protein n=1 Tax=Linum tenue TaxID=586396 RepID=A0AAV0R1E3_9ROSI|nr:unnamed protein product [Linum tenue]
MWSRNENEASLTPAATVVVIGPCRCSLQICCTSSIDLSPTQIPNVDFPICVAVKLSLLPSLPTIEASSLTNTDRATEKAAAFSVLSFFVASAQEGEDEEEVKRFSRNRVFFMGIPNC